MDYQNLETESNDDEKIQDGDVELSDVIEVIETDPEFRVQAEQENREMFTGGGKVLVPQQTATSQVSQPSRRHQACIKIIEQPAPKALRFRYECEGRSAGSIPGTNSTPENKTFPAIQIVGYQGKAVVVVSCVTKDEPHKPHPYKLVSKGNIKECTNGICRLEVDTRENFGVVQFRNMGVQCVKRRKMAVSLEIRMQQRVDPFYTGFGHRNQPTSIDLNTVRLCFQVFLEGDTPGKFTVPLKPVVSEPIFDKKAMSDLCILKLSDCVSSVDGGKKDIILLCEKVAKEDIQVRFYEENGDWEGLADFQPSQVHKQHAIWFRTPRYKTLDVTEPVKVLIQLRRPSDGATSESLPFELWPAYLLDSGRHWSLRRNLAKKGNYNLFNSILTNDAKLVMKRQLGFSEAEQKTEVGWKETVLPAETPEVETNNNLVDTENKEIDYSEVKKLRKEEIVTEEKSFNELINQVAELDEIYSETQARLLNNSFNELERPQESFDDNKTYSSLQLAFKNPVGIDLTQYDMPVCPPETNSPPANNNSHKREIDADKPPLPPKRTKKIETFIGNSMTSINKSGLLHSSNSSIRASTASCTGSLQRPKSQIELAPPSKHLPPTPNYSTLPNPKKRGFFSKLFGRNKHKSASSSREPSVAPSIKSSVFPCSKSLHTNNSLGRSTKSLQVESSLGKSSGNLSTHSSNSVRIPLKDGFPETPVGNADLPIIGGQVIDITGDDLEMNLDLTEAEHYALYTAVAPHATQSEFDEMSCYYAPVEGGKLLTNAEVLARLASKT
ncbi:hypothetical protein JTB14_016723 [Gonioctena quinquepunctata]|nr:hypothetical protein JTB14_016723 [Gonioctena quinquepunctata]